jgi:hypothetical protein
MSDTLRKIEEALKAPFREWEYEWRVKSETKNGDKVLVLCYVQARAVQNRLDEVMGIFGWQADYSAGPDGGVLCKLSLRNPDTGEWVHKGDGASNTEIEAVKGGISGALKRAASAWGIGRLLYDLTTTYAVLKDKGQHYHKTKNGQFKYWDSPRLPEWAVRTTDLPHPGQTQADVEDAEDEGESAPKNEPQKPNVDIAGLKANVDWIKRFKTAEACKAKLRESKTLTLEAEAFINEVFEEAA